MLFGWAILNGAITAILASDFQHTSVGLQSNLSVSSVAVGAGVQVQFVPLLLGVPDTFFRTRMIAACDSAGSIKGDGPTSNRVKTRRGAGAATAPVRIAVEANFCFII